MASASCALAVASTAQHRLVGCRVPELTEQTSDDAGVPSPSTADHAGPSIAGVIDAPRSRGAGDQGAGPRTRSTVVM